MKKGTIAKKYYEEGYNCCQAVVLAYAEEIGMDADALLRLSSSFGGGMGGLGEVCGAVSGMFLVLGALKGYDSSAIPGDKQLHYARIRAAASRFTEKYGSLLCRDLKSADGGRATCGELVENAAEMLFDFLSESEN